MNFQRNEYVLSRSTSDNIIPSTNRVILYMQKEALKFESVIGYCIDP